MNGTEIITFHSQNLSTIGSAVGAVSGAIFTAIFLRHNTSIKEFERIKAGHFKEVADELLTAGKMSYTEYYKANNFLKVAKKADEYFSEIQPVDKFEAYDFDWFVRFYEAVGNISNDEMQGLWAKILAGEISHPTTYSLRTIDVLKNLSMKEANLFATISSHAIALSNNYFLPNYDEYLERCGIRYHDIMKLSEQGLIYNDALIVLNVPTNKEKNLLFANENLVMTHSTSDEATKLFKIKQYPFTEVGKEIAALKKKNTSDDDLICFAKVLRQENKKIDIGVHAINHRTEESIIYNLENLLNKQGGDEQ